MHLQLRTCLLLLVGVLTTATLGTAATIGTRAGRMYFKSGASMGPSYEEATVDHPLRMIDPETSRLRNTRTGSLELGGSELSGVPLGEASAIAVEPPPDASPRVTRQAGTSEPPDELKPMLDVDELVALEFHRKKTTTTTTTTTTPSTGTSGATSVPAAVTKSDQPEADKVFSSQLGEVLKSILDESAAQRKPTPPRPVQPPRVDPVPQRPPLASTGDAAKFDEFLPQLEDTLKGLLDTHKPAEPQSPHTVQLPMTHTPKVPDTEEHLKHILPTLEETIGSILKDSETKIPVTTSQPVITPVNTTMMDIWQPSKLDSEEHLKHILPTLEETIGSILKDSETKIPVTTSQPVVTPVNTTMMDIWQPSKLDSEEHLKHILPALEETIGSILKDSETKIPVTTSQPVVTPVNTTMMDIWQPSKLDTEEHLKHILPTLEEALASILKDSEAEVQTTTRQPVLLPVHPATNDSREQFAAVMPQLEEAIRAVLEEAVLEQEAAAQRHPTLPPAWQPTPPTTQNYGFDQFLPELEQVFGDILRSRASDHGAKFTSTVKTPMLSTTASTREMQSFQNNIIESDSPSSHSEPPLAGS